MPLLPNILQLELSKIIDSEHPQFVGFPQNQLQMANNWGNALQQYASGIIPPSATLAAAVTAFKNLMATMNTSNGLVVFPQAFTTFALTLSTGMQPAFTATPPPAPISLTPVFSIPLQDGTNSTRISTMASIIDAWMRTGIAINNASGVSVPWS